MHTHPLAAKVVQLPQGMISDHETGSYHCCPLDLSESGSFPSSYVFCDLRKKIVPPPSAGGRDVVGLVLHIHVPKGTLNMGGGLRNFVW